MNPLELALRLVALRQAGLREPNAALRKRMTAAFRLELATSAAWMQTRPDDLEGLLAVLVTEIAQSRIDLGLGVLPAAAWSVPADPPVELAITGTPAPATATLVDRLAAQLAEYGAWTLTLDLGPDGGTITARPARVA